MTEQVEWLKARIADLQLPTGKRDHDTREKWLLECGMPDAQYPAAWQWVYSGSSQGYDTKYSEHRPTPSPYVSDITPLYAAPQPAHGTSETDPAPSDHLVTSPMVSAAQAVFDAHGYTAGNLPVLQKAIEAAIAAQAPAPNMLAPVDVYRVLKRAHENGMLDVDHLSSLSREIAALATPTPKEESK